MNKKVFKFFLLGYLFSALADPPSDFSKVIDSYRSNSGIIMNFKKKTWIALLKKHRLSKGRVFLSKTRVFMEADHSAQVIYSGKDFWYIMDSGQEKKAVKINLNQRVQSAGLVSFLFSPNKFFKIFQFVSAEVKGRTKIFHFKPIDSKDRMSGLLVKVEDDQILQVTLNWKDKGGKEEYTFFNIRRNQKIPDRQFQIPGQALELKKVDGP